MTGEQTKSGTGGSSGGGGANDGGNANSQFIQGIRGAIEPYVASKDFDIWCERLNIFFTSNGIEEAAKAPMLLSYLCEDVYILLRDLCTPVKPSSKSFKNLCAILSKHYSPQIMIYKERNEFYAAKRIDGEAASVWVARIKKLSMNCSFGEQLENILADKFITGYAHGKVAERIYEESAAIDLEKALGIALKYENRDTLKSEEINAVYAKKQYGGASSKQTQPQQQRRQLNSASYGGQATSNKEECKCCGSWKHKSISCKYRTYVCNKCNKTGHLAHVCKPRAAKTHHFIEANDENENMKEVSMYSLKVEVKENDPIKIPVELNGIVLQMEVDSGAGVSVISKQCFEEKFSRWKIQPTNIRLRGYGGELLDVVGMFEPSICYENKCKTVSVLIVNGGGPPILGRNFLEKHKLGFASIKKIFNTKNEIANIMKEYEDVFIGTGRYLMKEIEVEMKENVKPIFMKPRPVAYSLKVKVENEIDRLVNEGIISKVENSDWGTPLVPVSKEDGSIRLCGDYKVTINPHVIDYRHPLPRIDDLFVSLQGGIKFSKLDLSGAYNQLVLDEKSAHLCAWSTHKGVFRVNRLPFGVKSASGIFQNEIDKLVMGIPNVACMQDDIVITGDNDEKHLTSLKMVLEKLSNAGLKLKMEKCRFFEDEIEYLGFKINKDGIMKTNKRIQAIVDLPEPKNVSEVRAFAGMINYYSKFIKNYAMILSPIYNLLKKNTKFVWSNQCQEAFNQLKKCLISDQILVHYDPKLPLKLSTDASNEGIGAVLSHIYPNGDERPIVYISRTLSAAEKNYSVVQKEALGIVYPARKLYQYLIGKHFILECDQKSLLAIFGEKRGLPLIAASRLQRWALYLSAFDYEIRYKRGVDNSNADCLSRLCVRRESDEKFCLKLDSCQYINDVENECSSMLDFKRVRFETNRDSQLSKVMDYINLGFPEKNDEDLKPYKQRSNELSIERGIIMWGRRVVIPNKLRKFVLQELHKSHLGIVKTKSIARSYFWWPKIDQQIESEIKECRACRLCQPNPMRSVLIPWEICKRPWERVHVDFLGPVENTMFFIILDAYSKWVEAFAMASTNTNSTINVLRQVFARFGLPDIFVSDNGSQLVSDELEYFLESNGIIHKKSAPGHPATNGAAENAVKSFKSALAKAITNAKLNKNKVELDKFVQRYLFDYRIAKHSATEESPAKLMFGRELKSRFDLLKPLSNERIATKNNERKIENFGGKRDDIFQIGEKVVVRDLRNPNKELWAEACIKEKLGQRTYMCSTENGQNWRRHVDQIAYGGKTPERGQQIDLEQVDGSDISATLDGNTEISSNGNETIESTSSIADGVNDKSEPSSCSFENTPIVRRSNRPNRFKGKYYK